MLMKQDYDISNSPVLKLQNSIRSVTHLLLLPLPHYFTGFNQTECFNQGVKWERAQCSEFIHVWVCQGDSRLGWTPADEMNSKCFPVAGEKALVSWELRSSHTSSVEECLFETPGSFTHPGSNASSFIPASLFHHSSLVNSGAVESLSAKESWLEWAGGHWWGWLIAEFGWGSAALTANG